MYVLLLLLDLLCFLLLQVGWDLGEHLTAAAADMVVTRSL